jgi:hypothetical protein
VSIDGYVITSKGRIDTRVKQSVRFTNIQKIDVTSSQYLQDIDQNTAVTSYVTTTAKGRTLTAREQRAWPLVLDYNSVGTSSNGMQTTAVSQTKNQSGFYDGLPWSLLNAVQSSDTLTFTASGFTPSNGKSRQQYKLRNLQGYRCYDETIKSADYVLVSRMEGC